MRTKSQMESVSGSFNKALDIVAIRIMKTVVPPTKVIRTDARARRLKQTVSVKSSFSYLYLIYSNRISDIINSYRLSYSFYSMAIDANQ